MNLINVVAPIYNEAGGVLEFVKRVKISIEKITHDYKILLIDDGSLDNSWSEISKICSKDNKIIGIKLSKNFGHHYAITAGIHNSRSEWVIVMDSDLQDRPEAIPDLYQKALEGFDIVFVSRKERPESIFYMLTQKIFYFLLRLLSGVKFDSSQVNFSIINQKVVKAFIEFPEQARYYGSTVKWLGFRRTFVTASHGERFNGKPSYTLKKRIKLALDIILAFSDRPLKFVISFGTLMLFSTLLIAFFYVSSAEFRQNEIFNLESLHFLISISTSLILFALGIIGLYIGEIFKQVKNRPLYVIEKILN